MDFAGLHVEIHVVAGQHAGEPFGDAAHFEAFDPRSSGGKCIRFSHGAILEAVGIPVEFPRPIESGYLQTDRIARWNRRQVRFTAPRGDARKGVTTAG